MNSSKRAPPPPPLQIGVPVRSFTSPTSATSRSSDKTARSFSGDYSARPDFSYHNRVGSDPTGCSSSSRKSPASSSSPQVNVYTTCGRHSNQWLFSGWPNPFKKH